MPLSNVHMFGSFTLGPTSAPAFTGQYHTYGRIHMLSSSFHAPRST